jgi:hypothetical protein
MSLGKLFLLVIRSKQQHHSPLEEAAGEAAVGWDGAMGFGAQGFL